MLADPAAEIRPLRTALRDLVALSTIPAAWVGREPPVIAAGLADVLVGSLYLDFAFVRLCDPRGGDPIDMTRGDAWEAFPEWLQRHLAVVGQLSRKEIIPDLSGEEPSRGIVIPIGIDAEGGLVAAASDRADFPTEIDQLLLSVAANHAATAFQSARLEQELRQARGELEIKVAERTAELEDLAGRLIRAQEEERRRIGRELHDHISQALGVLTIKIDQLRAGSAITPDVAAALEALRHATTEVTDDVHRLSYRLHSSTLDYLGLVPALQKLVSEFSERHDIAITFAHASLPPSLPSEVALCLFRVAEESLTNVARHSHALSAHVHVAGAHDGIHLTVEDAGTGFDVTTLGRGAGLGFVSMQERLRVLHGTIRVDSAPARGTRVDAWVPAIILS